MGFSYAKPDDATDGATGLNFGVFALFYFAGHRGHSGLFVAPGVMISKVTDKVSWGAAAQLRDGDSFTDASISGVFGLSVFWRSASHPRASARTDWRKPCHASGKGGRAPPRRRACAGASASVSPRLPRLRSRLR